MFKQLVYARLVQRKRLVVFDAPLLFETSFLEHFCYPTIVVVCSEANELARLIKRDSISREDAEKRIQSQMKLHVRISCLLLRTFVYLLACLTDALSQFKQPDTQEKVKRADLVIENDGSLDDLLASARKTLQRTAALVGAEQELLL